MTPDVSVPPMPVDCARCGDPFPDGHAAGLVREYHTRPGAPDWTYAWCCGDCLIDLARALP